MDKKERIEFLSRFIYESGLLDNRERPLNVIEKEIGAEKQTGHVGAVLYLEKRAEEKETLLTEEDIKKVHALIFEETESWIKKINPNVKGGEYRKGEICFGEIGFPYPASLVPEKMHKLIAVLNKHQKLFLNKKGFDALELISDFHFYFFFINPFFICNGRVNRALLFYLLKYFGKKLFIIFDKEKGDYFAPFISEHPSPTLLHEFFIKKINKNPPFGG